jgi:hypothetical protein
MNKDREEKAKAISVHTRISHSRLNTMQPYCRMVAIETYRGDNSTVKSCTIAKSGPSLPEELEEEWHGDIHDSIGDRTNDTGDIMISF